MATERVNGFGVYVEGTPTPQATVDGFGVYVEGTPTPRVTVNGFGVYAEIRPPSVVTLNGFGVYSQLMDNAPAIWLDGVDITEELQSLSVSITVNIVPDDDFTSTGATVQPGLPSSKIELAGLWSQEIDNRLAVLSTGAYKALRVKQERVIYTWQQAVVTAWKPSIPKPSEGIMWAATLTGNGVPERAILT